MKKPVTSAADYLPADKSIPSLKMAARRCEGCSLFRNATQTVFGAGPAHARIVLIGEQPGDQEDREGLPFVGPAGKLLDRALEAADISRRDVYLTNAVKHFKFVYQGKRRLHQKPLASEIGACRPWLHAELSSIKPEIIVGLGVTAAQSIFGKSSIRLKDVRGKFLDTPWNAQAFITIHPSAILRLPDPALQETEFNQLVADLSQVNLKAKAA